MIKKTGLLLLLVLGAVTGFSQVPPRPAGWEVTFFETPALALPLLVTAAAHHSAELAAIKTDKAISNENIQLARKNMLSSFLINSNYGYGNLSTVALLDPSLPSSRAAAATKYYSSTLSFNLPLDRLLSRRNLIHREQLQLEKFGHLQQAQENSISQQVIDLYQIVLLAHRVLPLRQQAYLSAQINYQLSEKQFRDGETTLAELAQLNDRYINAAIEQENARNKYETSFLLLEEMIGGRISELITTK